MQEGFGMKIGAITIGQSPRVDVTADIMDIFRRVAWMA